MRRREFITLVGGAAAWPLAVRAQQPDRMRRIGVLMSLTADAGAPRGAEFVLCATVVIWSASSQLNLAMRE